MNSIRTQASLCTLLQCKSKPQDGPSKNLLGTKTGFSEARSGVFVFRVPYKKSVSVHPVHKSPPNGPSKSVSLGRVQPKWAQPDLAGFCRILLDSAGFSHFSRSLTDSDGCKPDFVRNDVFGCTHFRCTFPRSFELGSSENHTG